MLVITIQNPKGGSGKTTTALNLGAGFVQRGFKVGIADTDPNRSASEWADSVEGTPPMLVSRVEGAASIRKVRESSVFQGCDIVLIDGKADGFMEMSAAADVADIIVFTSSIASIETMSLEESLKMIGGRGAKTVYLLNRPRRGIDDKSVQELLDGVHQELGVHPLRSVIYFSDVYQRAYEHGKTVFDFTDFKKQQADVAGVADELLALAGV